MNSIVVIETFDCDGKYDDQIVKMSVYELLKKEYVGKLSHIDALSLRKSLG